MCLGRNAIRSSFWFGALLGGEVGGGLGSTLLAPCGNL